MKIKAEDLKDKTPEELVGLLVEAHNEHAKTIEGIESKEDLEKSRADVQAKQKQISDAMAVLEKAVKDQHDAQKAEIIKLKQGGGWHAEKKAEIYEQNRKALDICLRRLPADMDDDQKALWDAALARKGLAVGQSSSGGFLVTAERSTEIDKLIIEQSSLREFARIQTGSSNIWTQPTQTGRTAARYVGELTAPLETVAPKFGEFKIEGNKIESEPRVTQEMLDDSDFDVLGFLDEEVAEEVAILEGNRHFEGTDPNTPEGILTRPNGTAEGEIVRFTSASVGKIEYDDLVTLNVSLKKPYRPNARWLANKETIGDLRLIKDLEDRPLLTPDITRGGLPNIFERPVEEAFDMQENVAGKLSLAYGDFFKGYLIYDRKGLDIFRDPFTARPEIIFVHTMRSGGKVKKGEAISLLLIKS